MHDRVEMDNGKHDGKDKQNGQELWKPSLFLRESIVEILGQEGRGKNDIGHRNDEQWPGEKGKIRPDVEHLSQVYASRMKLLVAYGVVSLKFQLDYQIKIELGKLTKYHAVVPENECTKSSKNSHMWYDRRDSSERVLEAGSSKGDGGFEII